MKKQTLQKWIYLQKQTGQHEHNEALRMARMAALEQCETWLYALTWARMRTPVRQTCEDLQQEGRLLLQKGIRLSETEAARLTAISASNAIYTVFLHKITPTALQAEIEYDTRQREHARRQGASPQAKENLHQKTERNASHAYFLSYIFPRF